MMLTLYHNPRCSKSRQALKLLEGKGVKPLVIDYIKSPPSVKELDGIARLLTLEPKDFLRDKEDIAKELGITKDSPRDAILEAMSAHPKLIERPILINPVKGACIGRPAENVLNFI